MDECASCGATVAVDARFCPGCGAAVQRRPPTADERKVATVLFADLVGSTSYADAEDPERTRIVLDRFYDAMSEEIELAGGTVEKFVGDAVMAAFGAPLALEDHAERALHAALAMHRRLRTLYGDRPTLRIGVNTGEVAVGRPREGSSFVTGDAVNVAARLEQAAGPGEVIVGERTVGAVRGAFEFGPPLTVEAKGKPGGVAARKLVHALSLMRPRGVGGLHAAFVGRDEELASLQERYERVVREGAPHLVVVLGDAGVGKSRLVRELWRWLSTREPQPLQRTGRCLSYGHGVTYWPLAEILREHFAWSDTEPAHAIQARLGERSGLVLTLGMDAGEPLHPLVARERLQDAWVDFLQGEAQTRPVVALIEDVHWAEDELCDLMELIAGRVEGPLLVVATARPEFLERRPALCGARRNTSSVALETLPATGTRAMLEQLLGCTPPHSIQDIVVARAEGNPFFVEELLATLIDRGVLQRRNGGWTCSELPPGFEIPDTVQAVLAARIDLLPVGAKAALQAAAVIGRIFWTGPVYELIGGAHPDFGLLEERDFCRRRSGSTLPNEREYAIKHALTREVAYASLPKAKRAHQHAAFAAWLERTAAADDQAAMLAHHYAEAVRPEDIDLAWPGQTAEATRLRAKAVEWSRHAAMAAVARYEIDEALALLRRALEHESDDLRQAELWYEIGRASALKYDGEGFTRAMEKAIELGGPSAEVYAELAFQTVQRAGMWRRRPDREVVTGWIEHGRELSEPDTVARAKALIARATWLGSAGSVEEAVLAARGVSDPELELHAVAAEAAEALRVGDIARTLELERQIASLQPLARDPDQRATAQMNRADLLTGAGRLADVAPVLTEYDEIVRGLTPHHRLHSASARVATDYFSGHWDALRAFTPTIEVAVQANLDSPCPFNVISLLLTAVAHARIGNSDEAKRLEDAAESIGMEGYAPMFDPPRLQLALACGDLNRVEQLVHGFPRELIERWGYAAYEQLASLLDGLVALRDREQIEKEAPQWLAPGTAVEPFALRALGIARGDGQLLERAAERFSAIGLDWHEAETRRLIARESLSAPGAGTSQTAARLSER